MGSLARRVASMSLEATVVKGTLSLYALPGTGGRGFSASGCCPQGDHCSLVRVKAKPVGRWLPRGEAPGLAQQEAPLKGSQSRGSLPPHTLAWFKGEEGVRS